MTIIDGSSYHVDLDVKYTKYNNGQPWQIMFVGVLLRKQRV